MVTGGHGEKCTASTRYAFVLRYSASATILTETNGPRFPAKESSTTRFSAARVKQLATGAIWVASRNRNIENVAALTICNYRRCTDRYRRSPREHWRTLWSQRYRHRRYRRLRRHSSDRVDMALNLIDRRTGIEVASERQRQWFPYHQTGFMSSCSHQTKETEKRRKKSILVEPEESNSVAPYTRAHSLNSPPCDSQEGNHKYFSTYTNDKWEEVYHS